MVILNVILRKLSVILLDLSLQKVRGVGFLKQDVTCIFFILQDSENRLRRPLRLSGRTWNTGFLQLFFDSLHAVAIQKALRDHTNRFRILQNDFWLSIGPPLKCESGVAKSESPLLVAHADSLGNITADGFTLGLGKGAQAGQNHLAVHV